MSLRRFAALAASALLAPACASWFTTKLDPPAGQRLEDAWRLYRISEDAKAMAIAIDPASGQRVWGIVYGSLDQDSASRNALKECEENARAGGVAERCHLFAIGNRRAPSAVAACAEGRAYASFCALMNDLIPPTPQEPPR